MIVGTTADAVVPVIDDASTVVFRSKVTSLGTTVGDFDGASVRSAVGLALDMAALGVLVGNRVGASMGIVVGEFVGASADVVGVVVGSGEGMAVGAAVVTAVGAIVGADEVNSVPLK